MAFDAHFKAGQSVVIYHEGRIVEALIDGTGKIHRIAKDSRKRSKKTARPQFPPGSFLAKSFGQVLPLAGAAEAA